MTNPTEIIPGVVFYSYLSAMRKEKVGFLEHSILVLVVSGIFTLETAEQKISMGRGQMLLIKKNQLGTITKMPLEGEDYQTVVISLKDDLLRKIALDEQIETGKKYSGPANILISRNEFLDAFFQSVMPYIPSPGRKNNAGHGDVKGKRSRISSPEYHARTKGFPVRLF